MTTRAGGRKQTSRKKRGLAEGALADALDAHAEAPPIAALRVVELEAVQARFGGDAAAYSEATLDVAVLHLWDVGAVTAANIESAPGWIASRVRALTERGYFRDDETNGLILQGSGFAAICVQAGRAEADPSPDGCGCTICTAATDPGFNPSRLEDAPAQPDDYRTFLESKIKLAPFEGIEPLAPINPALKPHAQTIVRWAMRGGRRAIFANFGLHKTAIQIELMRQIAIDARAGLRASEEWVRGAVRPTLIVIPLGVRQEFTREAELRFTGDYAVRLVFIRADADLDADVDAREASAAPTVYLTNYESVRDGKLNPALFVAASLDEAAVLRSFGSKTYQEFLPLFEGVRFRFVATATPSPNRLKELIHYAGFLGIMDTGQALTRFFQRNSEKANDLTLYPHHEEAFWLWVHSWAVFLQRPSDLGPEFSDEGFVLPALDVVWHEVPSDHSTAGEEKSDGQKLLFKDAAMGLQQAALEKRESMGARVALVKQLREARPADHVVVWHDLEDEREALEAALPDAVSIFGTMELEERERRLMAFADGETSTFLTKPVLSGAGCNFQRHCAWEIFAGVGYKFHDFIQAVHRVLRFGQSQACRIDVIHSEAEREIVADLKRKWAMHDEMQAKMAEIIRAYGLDHSSAADNLKRSIGVVRQVAKGERYWIANNDCVLEARGMEENSVDLSITSIPFANQYEYVAACEDMGHTEDNAHFWAGMDFLTPEMLRVLKPGRLFCVHVKDRIDFGAVTGKGAPTVSPFHAEAIFHYIRHGFDFMGMITIVTDVVRENNQTYRLGWSDVCKDGTVKGVGSSEYVLLMRKPQTDRSQGFADDRVVKSKEEYSRARWQVDAHAFWRSSGNRLIGVEELSALQPDKLASVFTAWSLTEVYDYVKHVEIGEALEGRGALPAKFMAIAPGSHDPNVWHDVVRMLTLNSEQSKRRVEKHVCPLQFDIVDRLIDRYSNKDELVYDPFAGLGTVPYRALLKGRRGAGSELNPASFKDAVHYLTAAEREATAPTLFDLDTGETKGEAA